MPQINTKERMTVPLEIKQVGENGQFEGYGSTFGNVDLGDDVVVKGAFTETLKEWQSRKQLPGMFWVHSMIEPIGEYLSMHEDEKGLYVKGQLWVKGNPLGRESIARAEQARNMFTSSGPKGLSIGFVATKVSFGRQEDREVRFLEKVDLMEISPVPFGMNPEALILGAKSLLNDDGSIASPSTFEKALRDAGLSRSEAKTFMAKGYSGLRDAEEEQKKGGDNELLYAEIHRLNNILKGESNA